LSCSDCPILAPLETQLLPSFAFLIREKREEMRGMEMSEIEVAELILKLAEWKRMEWK
jgi:hypothetical protein